MSSIKLKSPIYGILLFALSLRVLFFFFGAEVFYGKSDFYINGDTFSFVQPMVNLVEHGTFTLDLKQADASFARLPGYSLVTLPFYLLFGDGKAFYLSISFFQIILDCLSCLLLFKLTKKTFQNAIAGYVAAVLYATYPFIIVWNPVVYAETTGVFVMLSIIYSVVFKKHPALTGALLAIGFFIRPQLLFLIPAILIGYLVVNKKAFIKQGVTLILGFLIIYLSWPLRNYVNHGEVVFMRDISSMRSWQEDVLYFHKYMNSLQAGWEPQMTQLISNEKIQFPEGAIAEKGDSALLEKAVGLSRECSDGFASFMKKPILVENCTEETADAWRTLYMNQMTNRSFNYFVIVPFKGLMKGIFKFQLISNWKSPSRSKLTMILTSGTFLYRTILILLGLYALFHFYRKKQALQLDLIVLAYFVIWYGWLCVVTRYLEMRYFLPADILLLIPASRLLAEKMPFLDGNRQA